MPKQASTASLLSALQTVSCSVPGSTTSPSTLPQPRARPFICLHCRTYADVRTSSHLPWPQKQPNSRPPTPYEIFHLDRTQPYSKRTFYELVKLYHPDRNGQLDTHCNGITHATKLERYRLVILAHEILSDPVKRREYDRRGVGWVDRNERWAGRENKDYYGSDRPFGFGAGYDASPFKNATWEDWEKWHTRPRGQSTQAYGGNYISPNGFASIIILLAVISGFAQATKAGQYSMDLEEKIRIRNEETTNFLQSRAGDSNDLGRDGRVRLFLEKRDPSRFGLKDGEDTTYQRSFGSDLVPAEHNA